jgi:hypothetical protein
MTVLGEQLVGHPAPRSAADPHFATLPAWSKLSRR